MFPLNCQTSRLATNAADGQKLLEFSGRCKPEESWKK